MPNDRRLSKIENPPTMAAGLPPGFSSEETYLDPIRLRVHLELGRCLPLEGGGGLGLRGERRKAAVGKGMGVRNFAFKINQRRSTVGRKWREDDGSG